MHNLPIALKYFCTGEYYHSLLAVDGLTMEDYSNCHPQYRMGGAYRRVFQQPGNFEWSIIDYDDTRADLAVTELTAIRAAQAVVNEETETVTAAPVVAVEATTGTPRYTALQLKFTLPPGTYATMLLRELTKESTESQFHSQLSNESHAKADNHIGGKGNSSSNNKRAASESVGETVDEEEPVAKAAKTEC